LEEEKFQITVIKYQTNHNDQNCPRFAWTPHPAGGSPVSKLQTGLCVWILEFGIYLKFGAWNLIFYNNPVLQNGWATPGFFAPIKIGNFGQIWPLNTIFLGEKRAVMESGPMSGAGMITTVLFAWNHTKVVEFIYYFLIR
jgi:hypothetical protein